MNPDIERFRAAAITAIRAMRQSAWDEFDAIVRDENAVGEPDRLNLLTGKARGMSDAIDLLFELEKPS